MAIVKWEPFGELSTLRRQMDHLMESFFGREPMFYERERWIPAVDVAETKDEIVVKVEAPGMDEKDISVTLSGDNLMIKGERKSEKEEKDKHFHRTERYCGSFQRVIGLPVSVDQEKIKADYAKGVLEIRLPKKAEAKPKEIPIKVG
jgi:HSP20 family protein